MDLQVRGNALCHFLPLCSPLTPSTAPPLPFHSRLHNHCTAHKGLSSQVQPRLARIKERFQLKMFFPSLFFFPQPAPFLFSLFFSCPLILSFAHICCTLFTCVSSILADFLSYISFFSVKASRFKMEKQVTITTTQGFSFALIETVFCPLQLPCPARNPAQTLTHIRLLTLPAPWLTPEEQSGSQQCKGVRSPICQNREYVSVCNYAERSFSLSATENGEPPFWWYSLGRRARWKREREGWRKGGSTGGM